MQVGANELVRDEVSRAGSYLSLRIAKVLLPRTSSGDALRTLVFWGIKVKDIILVLVIDLITFSCCGRAPLDPRCSVGISKGGHGKLIADKFPALPVVFRGQNIAIDDASKTDRRWCRKSKALDTA